MKVFGLHASIYRAAALASRVAAKPSAVVAARQDVLTRWRLARAHGLTAEQAARAVGISRATLYRWERHAQPASTRPHRLRAPRWRGSPLIGMVEQLRAQYPMWGKRKLAILLVRSGQRVSVSTTGRILRYLMERGRITAAPLLRRKAGRQRFRPLGAQRYAQRLPRGVKPTQPGELVQIDTLFINVAPETSLKHFTAYDPVAKWTAGLIATTASAARAAALLDKVIAEAPFPIRGIQVDGGAEFMAEFEQACAAKGLRLFVLPPKRPQLNGAVERAQSTWRYEFYACHELPTRIAQLQRCVDRFASHFNHVRPHQALAGLTPAEYLSQRSQGDPPRLICAEPAQTVDTYRPGRSRFPSRERHMPGRLAGKSAFVTAAGQGIGRATALAFAAEGARVVATDINEAALGTLASDKIRTARLDALRAEDIARAAKEHGPADILFNCAGFVHQGTIEEATEEEWGFAFELNVRSMFRTIRAFLPGMLEKGGGSIINMASAVSSIKGAPRRFIYGTTKAAVIGLTKGVAADYVARGIRCNAICPGTIATPSLEDRIAANAAAAGGLDAARAAFVARQAMGRLGAPEEIAALAVYLASDEARFMTGQTVVIDGGWTI